MFRKIQNSLEYQRLGTRRDDARGALESSESFSATCRSGTWLYTTAVVASASLALKHLTDPELDSIEETQPRRLHPFARHDPQGKLLM